MNLFETVTKHRKMWEWVARNIMLIKPITLIQIKRIYIRVVAKEPFDILNACYICEYVVEKERTLDCDKCPLNCDCHEPNSLYNRIVTHTFRGEYKKAVKLSYKMSQLPIKDETICTKSLDVHFLLNEVYNNDKMKDITVKEGVILEHRKMWNWISDNVIKLKPQTAYSIKKLYLQSQRINADLHLNDFICDYVFNKCRDDCFFCPIRWGASDFSICTDEEYGIFQYCLNNGLYKDASYIAKVISQLPIKE